MTGLDKKVSDFVLDHPKTQEFWKAWTQLLDTVMPGYIAEGKPQLSIAIGCTAVNTAALPSPRPRHVIWKALNIT